MADEGLREIQLDGKQLVFLFMAATVVAVVIFLCGVMVGRGVPGRAGRPPEDVLSTIDPTVSARPLEPAPGEAVNMGSAAVDGVSYSQRLTGSDSSDETLRPVSESVAASLPLETRGAEVKTPPKPAPAVTKPAAAARPAASTFEEPRGRGYVVQVVALPTRAEATTVARGLSSKGYPVFVTTSGSNFRVRIGKYANRGEAEAIANRLEREERIQPWITR